MTFNPDDFGEHSAPRVPYKPAVFSLTSAPTADATVGDTTAAVPDPKPNSPEDIGFKVPPADAPPDAPPQTPSKPGAGVTKPPRKPRRKGKGKGDTPGGDSEAGSASTVEGSGADPQVESLPPVHKPIRPLPPLSEASQDRATVTDIWADGADRGLRPQSTTDGFLSLILNELRVLGIKLDRVERQVAANRPATPEDIAVAFGAMHYLQTGEVLEGGELVRQHAVEAGQVGARPQPASAPTSTPFDGDDDREERIKAAAKLKFPDKKCPDCGREMVLRFARNGKNAGNPFWGCRGYYDEAEKCSKIVGCSLSSLGVDKNGYPIEGSATATATAATTAAPTPTPESEQHTNAF